MFCEFLYFTERHGDNLINHTSHGNHCDDRNFIDVVVTNASTFLFPCTIEYSLICAVILFEMWKHIETIKDNVLIDDKTLPNRNAEKILEVLRISKFN